MGFTDITDRDNVHSQTSILTPAGAPRAIQSSEILSPMNKVRKTKCKSCPFRAGSPYEYLAPMLTADALSESSRICHSTGVNAINTTNLPEEICRGSRDIQLRMFYAMGYIEVCSDEAWERKWKEVKQKTNTK